MSDDYAELRKALSEYEEDNNSSSAWNYIQAAHPRVISHLLKERDVLLEDAERYRWRPIETAPKNGDLVLLYMPKSGIRAEKISEGRWRAEADRWEFYMAEHYICAPTHWQHTARMAPPSAEGEA